MNRTVKEKITLAFIIKGWHFFARLPLRWVQAIATPLASLAWLIAKRERNITLVNLARCFPDLALAARKKLGRQAFIESARTLLEMGRMWLAPADKVLADLKAIEGWDTVAQANAAQKPVIILAPHLGQWEFIAQWVSSQTNFTFMYSPPSLVELDPIIRNGRCRTGGKLVPADLKGVAGLLKALRRGEMIGILPDQVPGRDQGGVIAPFYGYPAVTATLLPKLVQKTNAKVFTAVAQRLPKGAGYKLIFIPADEKVYSADEVTAAAGVNASVEQIISYAPDQYQWAYKRFKNVPDQVDIYKRR